VSALVLSKCIFLHVPKTGGTWAATALGNQGIVRATIRTASGEIHPPLSIVRGASSLPVIAAVREPVSWLRSVWRFYHARHWRRHPGSVSAVTAMRPLVEIGADSFAEFALRYLSRRRGYVSEVMESYAGDADAVCRQESLGDDLITALELFDEPHLPEAIRCTPPANESRKFDAECSEETEAAIREADSWVMERWYA
jgi:hypothetical protein